MALKYSVVALILLSVLLQITIQFNWLEELNMVMMACSIVAIIVALVLVVTFGDVKTHR